MPRFSQTIEKLIVELGQLPGVGPKTAERYAFALLRRPSVQRQRLAEAIMAADAAVGTCSTCRTWAESDPCPICADSRRDPSRVCVVATEQDRLAVESTGEFRGLYHVLGGLISAADGIGPRELTVRELAERVRTVRPQEIIFALDQNIDGETTLLYLAKLLAPSGARLTRPARGLPLGSEVGYADEVTLGDSLRGRREVPSSDPAVFTPQPALSKNEAPF